MVEHGTMLAVQKQELLVMDVGEGFLGYKPYSMDDVIRNACEWNMKPLDRMEDGMKNPGN